MSTFLFFSGHWDDHLALNVEAEARAERAGDFESAGRRASGAGYCHGWRGQPTEVLACADRAVAHWQTAGTSVYKRASTARLRGMGHELAKDYPAAIAEFRQELDLWRSVSPMGEGVTYGLMSLGGVLRLSGEFDEAETHYCEALAIAKALAYPEGIANCTARLAALALQREQWPKTEQLFREALELAEEVGRKDLVAYDCCYLAAALARQGRGDEGRCYAERAEAIFTELRSPQLVEAKAVLAECLA